MQFIDEAKIYIKSGNGGAGCMSFRREANIPKGGPDGGNGGRGASVIVESVGNLNTLIDFRFQQHYTAKNGRHGMGSNRNGAAAEDIIVKVPVGTQIFLEDKETLLIDITRVGQRMVIAKGGDGGLGNANFKSSTNQAPTKTTPGWSGEELTVWLHLKLLSDVGLVGLPNAGKSTFLSVVSRAKPKIADYPFTTLKPQLGVAYVDEREFVIADIPGLIEGASDGVGLGDRFLKHVERCGVMLHLVDGIDDDFIENYRVIRGELEKYSEKLAFKKEIVALNKCDSLPQDEIEMKKEMLEEACGQKVYTLSGVTGEGKGEVLRVLLGEVLAFRGCESSELSD